MTGQAWAALAAIALAAGCEAVPSLSFEDGGQDAGDAGTAAEAGAAGDAGMTDGGCPDAVPTGAALCCGVTPCYGTSCNQNNCFQCSCSTRQVCCMKSNGALGCAPDTLASCH